MRAEYTSSYMFFPALNRNTREWICRRSLREKHQDNVHGWMRQDLPGSDAPSLIHFAIEHMRCDWFFQLPAHPIGVVVFICLIWCGPEMYSLCTPQPFFAFFSSSLNCAFRFLSLSILQRFFFALIFNLAFIIPCI